MLTTALSPLKKYLKYKEITTDNVPFRLHCVLTTACLLAASIILTTTQLIGKPIECTSNEKAEDRQKVMTTFCWTNGTFTMPDGFLREMEVGLNMAHPGVMPGYGKEKKYYGYYQWVCFVLFFQAIMCYIPKSLWKILEAGLIDRLACGLNAFCPTAMREKKKNAMVDYLLRYQTEHKKYAFSFWGCELLCFVNIILQMNLMNSFLGGDFMNYGTEVISRTYLPQHERNDAMIFVFPRVTKCSFYAFGAGGGRQLKDNLCLLPQNVVNEKTYIFLWFWYIILAVVMGLMVVYRVAIVCSRRLRVRVLQTASHSLPPDTAAIVASRCDIGDWWLIYILSSNMDPLIYSEMVTEYVQAMKKVGNGHF